MVKPTYEEMIQAAASNGTAKPHSAYRVYLIDLQQINSPQPVLNKIFDSYEWETLGPHHLEEFDHALKSRWPQLIQREFGANPSNDSENSPSSSDASTDPYFESFKWGKAAQLLLQFSADNEQLYFRVVTVHQNGDGWDENRSWDEDLNTSPTVHRSFVLDISEPKSPVLRRAIVPTQAYYRTSSVLHPDKGKESFALSADMEYLASSHLIPKELANGFLSVFGARDAYLHLLRIETEVACDEFFDREMQRQNLLERRHAFKEAFDPEIRWFNNRLVVRKDYNSVAVYDVAQLLQGAHPTCSETPAPPRSMTPIFSTDDKTRLRFHGIALEYLSGFAVHEDYRTTQASLFGDQLIVSQRVPLLHHVSLNLTHLYDLNRAKMRYLVYPTSISKPLFGGPQTNSVWDDIRKAQGQDNEIVYDYSLRSSSAYMQLNQEAIAMNFEGETRQPTISNDGHYIYFMEWRLKAHPYYLVLREAGLKSSRHEAFEKIAWPVLARIPRDTGDESMIERLGYLEKNGSTIAGWHRGLNLSDAVIVAPVSPLTNIYQYLLLPTPLPPFSVKTPSAQNLAPAR
jgi:hypothetical protein